MFLPMSILASSVSVVPLSSALAILAASRVVLCFFAQLRNLREYVLVVVMGGTSFLLLFPERFAVFDSMENLDFPDDETTCLDLSRTMSSLTVNSTFFLGM